jgi:general secretion pathway protein J
MPGYIPGTGHGAGSRFTGSVVASRGSWRRMNIRNSGPESRTNSAAGFTLLELLVAMALLVIVVGALYSTYFSLMQGRDRAVNGMESRRELRGTLDLLRREIASAVYASGDKKLHFIVEDRDSFGKPASNLDFTTLSPPRSGSQPQSDQVTVAYRSVAQDGKLTLMRQARDIFYTSDPKPYPQVEELEGFLVECLSGDKWSRSWDTELNHSLPKSVRITLRIKEGEKTVDYVTVASPRISGT